MKKYKHEGDTLQLIAPVGGVLSGVGYVIGAGAQKIFVVAIANEAAAAEFSGLSEGVLDLKKNSVAFAVGDSVFWDDTAKRLDVSAVGRYKVGYCVKAAAAPDAVARIKLYQQAVVAV